MTSIKISKVKQYNSTYKYVITVNGFPVCITESANRAGECVSFLFGNETALVSDGKLRKILTKYRKEIKDEIN